MRFDWKLLEGVTHPMPWILAGGLDPHNLGEAVQAFGQQLRPKTLVEQVRGEHGPEQVEHGAGDKPAGVRNDLAQRIHGRRSH